MKTKSNLYKLKMRLKLYTVMCNTTLSPHLECWKKDMLQQYFSSSRRIKFAQEVNS